MSAFSFLECAMKRITRINSILTAANAEKIESLCLWISVNFETSIGWEQLTDQSGLSHKDLIPLFQIHKHQTPMAYIKNVREQKKRLLIHPQANLFES